MQIEKGIDISCVVNDLIRVGAFLPSKTSLDEWDESPPISCMTHSLHRNSRNSMSSNHHYRTIPDASYAVEARPRAKSMFLGRITIVDVQWNNSWQGTFRQGPAQVRWSPTHSFSARRYMDVPRTQRAQLCLSHLYSSLRSGQRGKCNERLVIE